MGAGHTIVSAINSNTESIKNNYTTLNNSINSIRQSASNNTSDINKLKTFQKKYLSLPAETSKTLIEYVDNNINVIGLGDAVIDPLTQNPYQYKFPIKYDIANINASFAIDIDNDILYLVTDKGVEEIYVLPDIAKTFFKEHNNIDYVSGENFLIKKTTINNGGAEEETFVSVIRGKEINIYSGSAVLILTLTPNGSNQYTNLEAKTNTIDFTIPEGSYLPKGLVFAERKVNSETITAPGLTVILNTYRKSSRL